MYEEESDSNSEWEDYFDPFEYMNKRARFAFGSASSSIRASHEKNPTRPKENMKSSVLERIANALAEDDMNEMGNVQFCVTNEISPLDINVEVDGLGVMTFPVNQQYIQKLIDISSKAKFGLRDRTIFDEDVRKTYEIKSDKLHVTINKVALTCMLSEMRDVLGLNKSSVLIPHLHNMLIYGPGHFFDLHQDSEKLEGMVASLVIILPSPHIGGDLIILHDNKKHVFSSENIAGSNAKCIGFYADCNHKVEKIKEGYRIALTYNLVLKSEEICSIKDVSEQLTNAVKDYFDAKVNKQLQNKPHTMLVYFLNHSYTEHGLRFSMLKGTDCINASALYGVAQKLNLVLHLALVEVQQQWATNGDDDGSSFDELTELMDNYITLSFWLDSNDKKIPFGEYNIDDDEVCWTRETEAFEPFNKEVEGYTGNEGVTADYFYKRAAIVLWPESSTVLMHFKLNYNNALDGLYELCGSIDNEQEVLETVAKAGKYLHPTLIELKESYLEKLISIALYIKDKDVALSIVSHYTYKIINSDIVVLLVKLQEQYGISWYKDLMNSWKNETQYEVCFIENIHSFVQTFLDHGGAASIVELLLDAQSDALFESNKEGYTWNKVVVISKRIDKTYQFLVACAAIQNIPLLDKVIAHLISNPEFYPNISLADLYLKLQDAVPSEYFSNYKLLKSYLMKSLNKTLALEMRSDDDWSIQAEIQCECKNCAVATSFLHSKKDKKKVWPLSKSALGHVQRQFYGLNLPVKLSTEKKGSSYKLIMVKNEQLHKDAKKRVDELKSYQEKLQKD